MKIKKSVYIFLVLFIIFVSNTNSSASNKQNFQVSEIFKTMMTPFYEQTNNTYVITGKNGNNIAQEMFSETSASVLNGNWQIAYDYYVKNVKKINYKEINYSYNLFSGDVGKTESEIVGGLLYGVYPNGGFAIDAWYDLQGTIYYNPNTKIISDILPAKIVNYGADGSATIYKPQTYQSKGKYSATFSSNAVFKSSWATFEPLEHSFMIYSE